MASRKSNIPLGSASKFNPRIEVSKDGSLRHDTTKGQPERNPDYERRKARVALRTGSPKPPTRVSLRSAGVGTEQISPTTIKSPSRLSGSPSRLGTSSKASIRIKPSPERKPWGAPTIRVPPYHEQSISRRKKIISEPAVEEVPPQPRLIRYTIDDLLALRPPPTARYAALSLNQEQATMSFVGHSSVPLIANFAVPAPQFNKLPTSFWEQQSAYFAQSTRHGTTSQLGHEKTHTFHTGNQTLVPKSQTPQAEIKPPSGLAQLDEQATGVEDLESKIRSVLSHRGRRRSSRSVRSVTWDDVVVPTYHTLVVENDVPVVEKPIPIETFTAEDVKQTETPLEAKQVVTPSAPENHKSGKKQKKEFYQYMKSITELKKGDRKKLLQLLEALKNLDSDDSSDTDIDTDVEAQNIRRKNKNAERAEPNSSAPKSTLNPAASAFQDRLSDHTDATDKPAPQAPKQRVVVPAVDSDRDPNEPVWVRSIDTDFGAQERCHMKQSQENKPHSQTDIFQSSPLHKTITPRKLPHKALHPAALFQQWDQNPLPQLVPYTISSGPLPSKIPHSVSVARESTKVNPKLPIIDLATGRIPDDDGPGREAHVVAWGSAILESFQQKYPMTGVQRALPPAPVKSTHAATIQQRLEYLLMEQKEKQARGEGLALRSGNLQGSKLVKQIYQADKDMKRLKAEIRRDEAQRKLREPPATEAELKMVRMMVPMAEKISEATTCVGSVHSEIHEEVTEDDEVTIILHHGF